MATLDSGAGAKARLTEIDGLRGWAALLVVLFHIFWEMFGDVVPGFRNFFTASLLNGPLAVAVFFVLSGEALSSSYFAGGGRMSVIRLAIKRHSRLSIPVLGSCLLVYILMKLGLTWNAEAGEILRRPDWIGDMVAFDPSIIDVLKYAVLWVYRSMEPEQAYNPNLWTMVVEFQGSMAVFLFLLVAAEIRHKVLIAGAIAIGLCLVHSFISCFFAGVILAQLRHSGILEKLRSTRLVAWGSWAVLVLAMFGLGRIDSWDSGNRLLMLASVAFVAAAFSNRIISNFLAHAWISQFLGRISFPLYLVQFPVFISFSSFLIVTFDASTGLTLPVVWGISAATLAVCVLAAVLFMPVERFTKKVGDRLVALFMLNAGEKPAAAAAVPPLQSPTQAE